MPKPLDLKQLTDALETVHSQLAKAQSGEVNEGIRQLMGKLSTQLRQEQAKFMASYPKTMAEIQKRLTETKQLAESTMAQLTEAKQKAAQAEAARKAAAAMPPPKVAEPTLDPNLGQRLRIELLERFGDVPKGKAGTVPSERGRAPDEALTPQTKEIQEMLRKRGLWK